MYSDPFYIVSLDSAARSEAAAAAGLDARASAGADRRPRQLETTAPGL